MDKKLDFLFYANQDYETVLNMYRHHCMNNTTAYIAQQACEKYLKHIICTELNYDITKTPYVPIDSEKLHDIRAMCFTIRDDFHIPLGYDLRTKLGALDLYYKDARYPGYKHSRVITHHELKDCVSILQSCRDFTFSYLKMKEQERDLDPEINLSEGQMIPEEMDLN